MYVNSKIQKSVQLQLTLTYLSHAVFVVSVENF